VNRSFGFILVIILLWPSLTSALKADFVYSKVCFGQETVMINTSTPVDSIFKVLWDLNGDGRFGDAVTDTVRITFEQPGLYTIGIKVISHNGAMEAVYKSVPVVTLTPGFVFDYSCKNLPVHFYNETTYVQDSAFQYIWNFGDGTPFSYLQNPTHNYLSSGEFTVILTAISLVGCIDSIAHTITIKDPPVVDVVFSGDTVFPLGDSVIATIVGSFDSIFWSTGETTQSITIKTSGYYFVQGFLNGCYAEYFFSVTAIEDNTVRIMNLFTPNGDGFNDYWEIINIHEVAPCSVDVFDRWGQKVFSASPYNNDWDGTFNGKKLSNDTYYYFIRCKDNVLQKGSLNILR
jgi:gliding motility-associated-like protein